MSVKVYAANLQADALSKVTKDLHIEPRYAILERSDKVKFPGPSEEIEVASWPVGHVFGPQVEVYWEKNGAKYSVRLAYAKTEAPPDGFREVLTLNGAGETILYYLWGEDDMAIGGRVKYSQTITGSGRAQLGVVEYRDEEGRLVFYRYLELKREASDG